MENAFFPYFVLFLTFGWGQGRVVKVPEGPLVRVEGQSVSVRCTVSDYEGPREQDFEWKVKRGDTLLQLISTFDPAYTDRTLQSRVDNSDFTIKRLGDATVELRIQNLRAEDSTVYRCSTPSTDSVISGNYDADVELKVIGDSLKVSAAPPPAVVPEGGPIKLLCNATLDPTHHTYLSIAWSLKKGATSEDILTFGPNRGVTTGGSSRQRYAEGGLRLDLQGLGSYGLVLTEARPADQGTYVCTAKQWVLEKGGVWQQVLERSVEMGEVQVTPTAQSLVVTVDNNRTLSVDDTLNLTCTIAADDLTALGLEVTWVVSPALGAGPSGPRVLVHMSQDGVVTGSSDHLGVSRVGTGTFSLVVHGVDRSDSGQYSCRVRAWVRQSSGKWYQAAEKTSNPAHVLVAVIEPELRVTIQDIVTPQSSGDPTELECQVTDVLHLQDGRLGVSWHYTDASPADQPINMRPIAMVDEQGNLQPGDEYQERMEKGLVILSRVKPHTFKLRLLHTQDTDMGQYYCTVSAWTQGRDGAWAKNKEVQSDHLRVSWIPKKMCRSHCGGLELRKPVPHSSPRRPQTMLPFVLGAGRKTASSLGDQACELWEGVTSSGSTFEMSCQVKGENLQNPGYSVLIQMEGMDGGKARKILSLSQDSVMKLEEWDELGRLDSVVLEKTSLEEFRFRLYSAQVTDRGSYYCVISAWTPGPGNTWAKAASPAFNVSIQSETTSVVPGETAKMECIMTALGASRSAGKYSQQQLLPSLCVNFLVRSQHYWAVKEGTVGDVSYEVRWYHSGLLSLDRPAVMVSMDRWGVVRKSPRNGSSDCSLEQTDTHTFALSIHSVQDGDAGEYHCTATPWRRSSSGAWTSGHDLTSDRVFLSITLAGQYEANATKVLETTMMMMMLMTMMRNQLSVQLKKHKQYMASKYIAFIQNLGLSEAAPAVRDGRLSGRRAPVHPPGLCLCSVLLPKFQAHTPHPQRLDGPGDGLTGGHDNRPVPGTDAQFLFMFSASIPTLFKALLPALSGHVHGPVGHPGSTVVCSPCLGPCEVLDLIKQPGKPRPFFSPDRGAKIPDLP
ncbi:hypothetical protein JZ751_028141, partial [Albula glossodonta]